MNKNLWFFPLIITGVFVLLTFSYCSKDETTNQLIPKTIGQSYGGGIIFYVDGTGQHGIIAAASDQSTGVEWGCYQGAVIETSTAIGSGQANTTAILEGCSTPGTAARICDSLVLNGYSDWFLPSKDELNLMFLQKSKIGGFAADGYYWSSSDYTAYCAWAQDFRTGTQSNGHSKTVTDFVRAIRVF
jgi:hypothetical protein